MGASSRAEFRWRTAWLATSKPTVHRASLLLPLNRSSSTRPACGQRWANVQSQLGGEVGDPLGGMVRGGAEQQRDPIGNTNVAGDVVGIQTAEAEALKVQVQERAGALLTTCFQILQRSWSALIHKVLLSSLQMSSEPALAQFVMADGMHESRENRVTLDNRLRKEGFVNEVFPILYPKGPR